MQKDVDVAESIEQNRHFNLLLVKHPANKFKLNFNTTQFINSSLKKLFSTHSFPPSWKFHPIIPHWGEIFKGKLLWQESSRKHFDRSFFPIHQPFFPICSCQKMLNCAGRPEGFPCKIIQDIQKKKCTKEPQKIESQLMIHSRQED